MERHPSVTSADVAEGSVKFWRLADGTSPEMIARSGKLVNKQEHIGGVSGLAYHAIGKQFLTGIYGL